MKASEGIEWAELLRFAALWSGLAFLIFTFHSCSNVRQLGLCIDNCEVSDTACMQLCLSMDHNVPAPVSCEYKKEKKG